MTEFNQAERVQQSLKKRYRAEVRFRWYGRMAVGFALLCLLTLFTDIISKGIGAFRTTAISLDVTYDLELVGVTDLANKDQLLYADWDALGKQALRQQFPEVSGRKDTRQLYRLISNATGFELSKALKSNPQLVGQTETIWVLADDDIDTWHKSWLAGNAYEERLTEKQINWLTQLATDQKLKLQFNTKFFTNGDSREPEQAGVRGALMGSLLTLAVTFLLSFPIGIAAAIYLEEFAPNNRLTDFVEVNINNLAAVPSIIFGLLGLAIFINFFEMPRSAPLIGGLVLSLMTLPTIIITSRAAIKAVPPSIREAAIGLGASQQQVVWHHVLPLAMPGMLTGGIIGMAQALGETAPLLMIGMVAFIVDIPSGVTDPATVLPVQIFLWADSPERAFVEKTSAAIMVLLSFLILMNAFAIYLRKRLEKRW